MREREVRGCVATLASSSRSAARRRWRGASRALALSCLCLLLEVRDDWHQARWAGPAQVRPRWHQVCFLLSLFYLVSVF